MFWGLQLEPNLRYSQQVPEGFRITKATLSTETPPARSQDPASKIVQVFVDQDGSEYAIATLKHGEIFDTSLDLRFAEGEDICFYLKGDGIVFLTGHNLYPDDPNDDAFYPREGALSDSSEGDFDIDEFDEEADGPEIEDITERANKVKRNSLKASNGDVPAKKDLGLANKKDTSLKALKAQVADEKEEDDEDDDDDLDSADEDDSMDEDEEDEDESEDEDEDESDEDEDEAEDSKGKTAPGSKRPERVWMKLKGSPDPKKPKLRSPPPKAHSRQNGETSQSEKHAGGAKTNESVKELIVEDVKVGTGPMAKKGKTVRVYYIGKLLNGKTFDQMSHGPPFEFKLGTNSVIKGWEKGLEGMRVGGKRRLIVPPSLAYGKRKMGPIPAGSALQFEIELKAIV